MLAAMIFCGLLNVLAERIAYRPLRRAPRLAPLISAIGVSFIFVNIAYRQGPTPRRFPDLLPQYDFVSSSSASLRYPLYVQGPLRSRARDPADARACVGDPQHAHG